MPQWAQRFTINFTRILEICFGYKIDFAGLQLYPLNLHAIKNEMNLNNKIAVVTGVSKGIGLALCKQLVDKGAIVYGLGRNQATEISHPNFHFIVCDVQNSASVQTAFSEVYQSVEEIHVLVNNAGLGYFGYLENMPEEQWHEMFNTNIRKKYLPLSLKGIKPQGPGEEPNK